MEGCAILHCKDQYYESEEYGQKEYERKQNRQGSNGTGQKRKSLQKPWIQESQSNLVIPYKLCNLAYLSFFFQGKLSPMGDEQSVVRAQKRKLETPIGASGYFIWERMSVCVKFLLW